MNTFLFFFFFTNEFMTTNIFEIRIQMNKNSTFISTMFLLLRFNRTKFETITYYNLIYFYRVSITVAGQRERVLDRGLAKLSQIVFVVGHHSRHDVTGIGTVAPRPPSGDLAEVKSRTNCLIQSIEVHGLRTPDKPFKPFVK